MDESETSSRELIQRWCALTTLGSRRLRARANSANELNTLWLDNGCPELERDRQLSLDRWLERGPDRGHTVLFRWSTEFPPLLRQIPDPPVAVFVVGQPSTLSKPRVSVVGSRSASHSGMAFARELAGNLSAAGVLVVSGLAQGIDCAAHEGALLRKYPTVAIPGSGLDNLYPRIHRGLAEEILQVGGVLLSEYAPWVAPHKSSFPARNRLISGLTAGVVVVQAALRSGSLITARLATEQNREVMAVPGAPGSPVSAGCNALLREGAAVIESSDDVFDALGWERPATSVNSFGNGTQGANSSLPADSGAERLLAAIDSVPVSLEVLTQFVGLPAGEIERCLLGLELRGLVLATAQGYIRAP